MTIGYRGTAFASAGNGGNAAVDLTGIIGLAENDLVILVGHIGDNDDNDFTLGLVESGWTKLTDLFADDSLDANFAAWYKKMGATPDIAVTLVGQGGNDATVGAVAMAFSGVDTATPMDVTPTTATGINAGHPNPPSIDHNNPAGVWVVIGCGTSHTEGAAGSYSWPTGYTTYNQYCSANDSTDMTVGIAANSSPGDPEDPGVVTLSGDSTDYAWAAITIALRPTSATINYKSIDETWQASEAIAKKSKKAFAENMASNSESFSKKAKKVVAETWQAVETLRKKVSHSFAETWSAAETLTKSIAKAFAEAWDAAETFLARKVKRVVIDETWQASEALAKKTKKTIGETWQAAETLVKSITKSFAESWQASEVLIGIALLKQSFAETWQAAENFVATFHAGGGPIATAMGFLRRIFTKQS